MLQVGTHPKQNVPQVHRDGGAFHKYVGQVGGATPRLDDDVVKAAVLFDVRSGRSFVSALSARRSWRISR